MQGDEHLANYPVVFIHLCWIIAAVYHTVFSPSFAANLNSVLYSVCHCGTGSYVTGTTELLLSYFFLPKYDYVFFSVPLTPCCQGKNTDLTPQSFRTEIRQRFCDFTVFRFNYVAFSISSWILLVPRNIADDLWPHPSWVQQTFFNLILRLSSIPTQTQESCRVKVRCFLSLHVKKLLQILPQLLKIGTL